MSMPAETVLDRRMRDAARAVSKICIAGSERESTRHNERKPRSQNSRKRLF